MITDWKNDVITKRLTAIEDVALTYNQGKRVLFFCQNEDEMLENISAVTSLLGTDFYVFQSETLGTTVRSNHHGGWVHLPTRVLYTMSIDYHAYYGWINLELINRLRA
jgi:predicted SpoU family rRNA methylase